MDVARIPDVVLVPSFDNDLHTHIWQLFFCETQRKSQGDIFQRELLMRYGQHIKEALPQGLLMARCLSYFTGRMLDTDEHPIRHV